MVFRSSSRSFLLTFATLPLLTVLSYMTERSRKGLREKGDGEKEKRSRVSCEFTQRTVTRLQTRSIGSNAGRWRQQPCVFLERERKREKKRKGLSRGNKLILELRIRTKCKRRQRMSERTSTMHFARVETASRG